MSIQEVFYRYRDQRYAAPLDEWEQPCGPGTMRIILETYKVLRHTPKGPWIAFTDCRNGGLEKFIRRDANKRFACATTEEAMISFKARKQRQVRIYTARLSDAQKALDMAGSGINYADRNLL